MSEHEVPFLPAAQQQALSALMALPEFGGRVCAPSRRDPAVCAFDDATPTTLWQTPDGEGQADRFLREKQARRLCAACPVLEACARYAVDWEHWNVWGGMTAPQREAARRRRNAATVRPAAPVAGTTQRRAVLVALAGHYGPAAVAAAAGMDERTAAWQRARLVTLLHLHPRTATRMQLLYAARTAGLLDPRVPILANRARVVAAVPGEQGAVERAQPRQLPLPGLPTTPVPTSAAAPVASSNTAGPPLVLLPVPTAAPQAAGHGADLAVLEAAA